MIILATKDGTNTISTYENGMVKIVTKFSLPHVCYWLTYLTAMAPANYAI